MVIAVDCLLRPWWLALLVVLVYLGSGFALRAAEDYVSYQGTVSVVNSYPPLDDYVAALRGKAAEHDYVVGFSDTNFVNRIGKREHGLSTADYYMETLLGIDGTFIATTTTAPKSWRSIFPPNWTNHPYLLVYVQSAAAPGNF